MNDEEIAVRLSLKDRAEFSREAQLAAHDIDDIGDQADQSSRRLAALGRVGRTVGRVGLTAVKYAALGAASAIGFIGYAAIKAYNEAAIVAARTNAVIESTGGVAGVTQKHVESLSNAIMGYSGISDEAVASSANVLLQFDQIRNAGDGAGAIFDRAVTSLSDWSAATGKDATAAAKMLGRALQDPANGYTALTRLTGTFTDEQIKAITTMQEAGNMAGAQGVILDQLEHKFAGAGKAIGDTAQGQFNVMKETVGNALEDIGAALAPVAVKVLPTLTKALSSGLEAMAPAIADVAKAVGSVLGPLLKGLSPVISVLAKVFSQLAKSLGPVVIMIGKVLAKGLKMLMPALKPLITALGNGLLTILKAMLPVMPDIVKAFVSLIKAFTPLIPVIAQVVAWFLKMGAPMIKGMAMAVTFLAKWVIRPITHLIKGLFTDWSGTWQTIKEVFIDAWNGIKGFFGGIWTWLSGIPGRIGDALSGMWDGLKAGFKAAINWIINIWNNLDFTVPPVKIAGHEVFGGFTVGMPDIPTLHQGGTVMGGGAVNMRPGEEIVVLPPAASVIPLTDQTQRVLVPEQRGGWPEVIQVVLPNGKVLAEVSLQEYADRKARR